MGSITNEQLTKPLFALLTETFDKTAGAYLDRDTSLLNTLDTLNAAQASKPTIPGGTTIAGHVFHVRFYLRAINDYMEGKWYENLDWKESWTLSTVTDAEWEELRRNMRGDYAALMKRLGEIGDWSDEKRLGGAMAIIAHTAFHLGAIRQMTKLVALR